MNQRAFKATATREGKWWVVDVSGVGVTQGRTAAEARTMAVGLVQAVLDIDEPRLELEFAVRTRQLPRPSASQKRRNSSDSMPRRES